MGLLTRMRSNTIVAYKKILLAKGQNWFWTPEWQKREREADEDIKNDRVRSFSDNDEFLAALDQ